MITIEDCTSTQELISQICTTNEDDPDLTKKFLQQEESRGLIRDTLTFSRTELECIREAVAQYRKSLIEEVSTNKSLTKLGIISMILEHQRASRLLDKFNDYFTEHSSHYYSTLRKDTENASK